MFKLKTAEQENRNDGAASRLRTIQFEILGIFSLWECSQAKLSYDVSDNWYFRIYDKPFDFIIHEFRLSNGIPGPTVQAYLTCFDECLIKC